LRQITDNALIWNLIMIGPDHKVSNAPSHDVFLDMHRLIVLALTLLVIIVSIFTAVLARETMRTVSSEAILPSRLGFVTPRSGADRYLQPFQPFPRESTPIPLSPGIPIPLYETLS
jgi:hypothetical protein